MANKTKDGLDYFPMDVTIFTDIKIRKLIKYQGGKAVTVYAYLLCNIYKNGYYIKWDDELPFTISESTGYDEAYIQEVIKCCFKVDIFSKQLFDVEKVITSRGVQVRYAKISKLLKRKSIVSEFNLIDSEELGIDSEELPQRKEKEKKEKESKANNARTEIYGSAIFYELEELQNRLLIDELWIEVTAKNLGAGPEKIKAAIPEFITHLAAQDTHQKSMKDAKQHFNNWYPKRNSNQNFKNGKSIDQNEQARVAANRIAEKYSKG